MNSQEVELFDGIILPKGSRYPFKKSVSTKVKVEDIKIRNHPAFNRRGQAKQLTATEFIAKDEFLGYYGGQIVNNRDESFEWNPYQITPVAKGKYDIDGMRIGNIMRYINDPKGITNAEPNAKFFYTPEKFKGYVMVEICALKDIQPGEEIFASYGEPYWTGLQTWYEKENPYACPNCEYRTDNKEKIYRHILNERKKKMKKPYECENCHAKFSYKEDRDNHLNMHTGDRIYKCDQCIFHSRWKVSLNEHKSSLHGSNQRKWKCFKCNSLFKSNDSLKNHTSAIHEKIKLLKSFKCEFCSQTFAQNGSLKIHIKTVHEKLKPFKCNQCPEEFAKGYTMKIHQERMHIQGNFKCDGCEQIFHDKYGLREHKKKTHRYYECDKCGYKSGELNILKKHREKVHEEKRSYKCDRCDSSFLAESDLENHVKRVHDKIKEFKCDLCENEYMSKNSLKRHTKTIHEKKRPYKCDHDDCNYTSIENRGLKRHKLRENH